MLNAQDGLSRGVGTLHVPSFLYIHISSALYGEVSIGAQKIRTSSRKRASAFSRKRSILRVAFCNNIVDYQIIRERETFKAYF
jgi:hypothetical protein